jgi:surface protein
MRIPTNTNAKDGGLHLASPQQILPPEAFHFSPPLVCQATTAMTAPSVQYVAVLGSDESDEEAAAGGSSSDAPMSFSAAPQKAASVGDVVVEAEAFLQRLDSDECDHPSPISSKVNRRCSSRTIVSVAAGLVLSLVLIVAVLSQTLSVVTSRSPSTQPPPAAESSTESNSKSEGSPPSSSSSPKLVDYTWDGKKCFESNAELRVAIDSYLLDRNNATIEQLYGLPIGSWCVRNIRDFAFAFASEGRRFSFPDRADELRDLMERFNDDITTWDITGAKSLDRMFRGAKQLNQDLSKWDVSRVESMLGTFEFTQRFDAGTRTVSLDYRKVCSQRMLCRLLCFFTMRT